ncbi:recombinase family protein [Paenarthrobacter sp. YIM B13468]|uniref:recombinase family protein n=1 Tax=Paenarthrobacter sp. YIM B13468 TaxID=3366295 RepID=UPI00366FEF94
MAQQRAAIYARISEDKTGAGLGVQRQLEDCQALAASQGWTVAKVFTDNDISAYSGKKRPGYREMLSAMESGDVDVVLAWHTDRLHRSPLELEEYISLSEKHGVTTRTVQAGELDLSTATGRMTARIHGAVSRQESEHKADRIRREQQQKAMNGQWTGGARPFGWQFVDRKPVIEETEAAIIREAHSHVLAGLSLGSFIDSLAERGVKTARGGSWSYATLRQMLMRPRNAGLAEWKGEIVGASEFPAIVERHVWEATRSVLTDPARRRSTTNKVKYLLAGIALCECLRPVKSGQVVDRKGVKHMIYRCSERGPGHVNKRIEYVDAAVEERVLWFLASADRQSTHAVDPEVVSALRTDESAYRERLNEAARMFASGDIDSEQLAAMSKGLRAKLTETQAKLAALDEETARSKETDLAGQVDWKNSDASAHWSALHVERKRAWLRANMVIVLHRHARGSARVFDPLTIQVALKATPDAEITQEHVADWRATANGWGDLPISPSLLLTTVGDVDNALAAGRRLGRP